MKEQLNQPIKPSFGFLSTIGCSLTAVGILTGCVSGGPGVKGSETEFSPTRLQEFFAICFSDPAISTPTEEIVEKVRAQTQHLGKDRIWNRALVTHESGGDPAAVSATGSTGLFAISPKHLPGPPCCVPELEDQSEFVYDVCNSERVNGFHCDRENDMRFNPSVSFEIAGRLLKEFHSFGRGVREPASERSAASRFALPIFWNGGPKIISDFPNEMNTIGGVFSRLDFRRDQDYHHWKVRALSNKWIEMFDYLKWFEYLTSFWSQRESRLAQRTPQAVPLPKFNCGIYDPDSVIGGNRVYFGLSFEKQEKVEKVFQKIRVKRLRFGDYGNEYAFLGRQGETAEVFSAELSEEKKFTHLNQIRKAKGGP